MAEALQLAERRDGFGFVTGAQTRVLGCIDLSCRELLVQVDERRQGRHLVLMSALERGIDVAGHSGARLKHPRKRGTGERENDEGLDHSKDLHLSGSRLLLGIRISRASFERTQLAL